MVSFVSSVTGRPSGFFPLCGSNSPLGEAEPGNGEEGGGRGFNVRVMLPNPVTLASVDKKAATQRNSCNIQGLQVAQ